MTRIFCILLTIFMCTSMLFKATIAQAEQTSNVSKEALDLDFPQHFYKKFKGSISTIPITMDIEKHDSLLTGTYYYNKVGLILYVNGILQSDGSFELKETNEAGEKTGQFNGSFTDEVTIEGMWINALNGKSLPFKLSEYTEGIAGVSFANYYRQACLATANIEIYKDNPDVPDSLCSFITLHNLSIKCSNSAVTKMINDTITQALLNSSLGNFHDLEEMLNSVNTAADAAGFTYDFYVSLMTNEPSLLCVQISQYGYFYGAAHPMGFSDYLNFDLITAKRITLDDILIAGYKEPLNVMGKKKFIAAHGSEGWFFEDGPFEMTSDFAIFPGGLAFMWDQYEIGPYVMGTPEIFFTWKELESLINPNGQAAVMVKKRNNTQN